MSVFISDSENYLACRITNLFFDQQGTSNFILKLPKILSFMENKRIQFPKGKQKEFIKFAKNKADIKFNKNKNPFGINYNTLQNYYKEFNRISKSNFDKICNFINENPKKILRTFGRKEVIWKNENAFLGKTIFGKVKNNTNECNIKYETKSNKLIIPKFLLKQKKIKIPTIITPKLAYEIGTSLGDGCITKRADSYTLKGNKNNEVEYYKKVIKPLIKELYNIDVNLREYGNVYGFEIYSKDLVNFKNKVLGLPIGSKNNCRIPKVIKVNNKEILNELISGLFDTDGNIYFRSQGKNRNYYPVLTISTISKYLANDVYAILKMLGFNPYLFKNKKINKKTPNPRYDIILNGYKNFELFNLTIGTKQIKNLNKIEKWRKKWPNLANGWDSLAWSRIFGCGNKLQYPNDLGSNPNPGLFTYLVIKWSTLQLEEWEI